MTFIDDWKKKFPKLWSIRLSILASLASAAEVALNMYATGTAPKLVIAAGLGSLCAAFARIISQPSVTGNGDQ